MDKQQYLNHISSNSGRPSSAAAPGETSLLDKLLVPKNLKIILIALALIIILMIVAASLGSGAEKATELTGRLSLRLGNLNSTISSYSGKIKNPELRAISTSLSTTFTDTSRDLTALLPELEIDPGSLSESTSATLETDHITELNTVLYNASLNGILDRVYANNLTRETSLLVSLELDILSRTENTNLTALLTKSSTDLTALHSRISDFANKSN